MPVVLGGDEFHDLVEQLRAAGCVFAEDEAVLLAAAAESADELAAMVGRRVDGAPVEVVVGWAEFCGLHIRIEPRVFVPRRRTEGLALAAADRARAGAVVVDLCCGSGAIGAVVASRVPGVVLHAADIDPVAVRCARLNLSPYGGHVHEGDLFAALPAELRGRVDVLVVNAPYVPTAELAFMPPEARVHEPMPALDGGPDGLDVHRRVAADVGDWLAPAGVVLAECSEGQAAGLRAAYSAAGVAVVRR